MKKTVVLDVVGLSRSVIGQYTPFLTSYIGKKGICSIGSMLPSLTTSTQSTYLTGTLPSATGIVGNGWYDRVDSEIKFWKQSNKLVGGEKIWERAKKQDPNFTVSKMFWWYNMYSSADYAVTPRPNYLADGRKMPDCYSHPPELRDILQEKLGTFPLFQFWGPGANIESSRWIAGASMITDELYDPTLSLIYLPHLDYCLQKFGPDLDAVSEELVQIDSLIRELVEFYESRGAAVLILSEYGIAPVQKPVHINRILRREGLLGIRIERGLELLDPGASRAFAVADHQIAHVYINDLSVGIQLREILENIEGIQLVLDKEQQKSFGIAHERSGDLVLMADESSWFTYYFWLEDRIAPDYARCVDIHKKPGYDPVEMFMSSKLRAGYKLLRKKAGFRYVMDVIPLEASLVKGSHGRLESREEYLPVMIGSDSSGSIAAVDVFDRIWAVLNR